MMTIQFFWFVASFTLSLSVGNCCAMVFEARGMKLVFTPARCWIFALVVALVIVSLFLLLLGIVFVCFLDCTIIVALQQRDSNVCSSDYSCGALLPSARSRDSGNRLKAEISKLKLRAFFQADRMVRCFDTRCSGLGLRCCARRDRMVHCFATRCSTLGLYCGTMLCCSLQ